MTTWSANGTSLSPRNVIPFHLPVLRVRQVLFHHDQKSAFMTQDRKSFVGWLQAAPMMLVFAVFFLLPLVFVTIVSAWDYNEYEMISRVQPARLHRFI